MGFNLGRKIRIELAISRKFGKYFLRAFFAFIAIFLIAGIFTRFSFIKGIYSPLANWKSGVVEELQNPSVNIDQLPRVEVDKKEIFENAKKDWKPNEEPEFEVKIPGATVTQKKPASFLGKIFGAKSASAASERVLKAEIDSTPVNGNRSQQKDGIQTEIKDDGSGFAKVRILRPERKFRVGDYSLRVEVLSADGKEVLTTRQDFTWGVLAINVNKSVYAPGEQARLMFGVLDPQGGMVCDARLTLDIKDPSGQTKTLTTDGGDIRVNDICKSHEFSLEPDFESSYETGGAGTYVMSLTAESLNGKYTISDKFEVQDNAAFDVERVSATRTYPENTYPVIFNIVARQDFSGAVTEQAPAVFDISPGDGKNFKTYDKEDLQGAAKVITWNVSMKKGDRLSLGYQYKPPVVSPEFYLLGPMQFTNGDSHFLSFSSDNVVFQEARQWEVANDTIYTCATYTTGTWNWGTAANWSGCNGGYPGQNSNSTDTYNVNIGSSAAATIINIGTTPQYPIGTLNTGYAGTGIGKSVNVYNGGTNSTLTLTGRLNMPCPTSNNIAHTLNVGGGTLNANAGIGMTGSGTTSRLTLLRVTTGTINIGLGITGTGTIAQARFISTGASTVNVTGGHWQPGAMTGTTAGTINLSGTSPQNANGSTLYRTFKINNSAGVTMLGASSLYNLVIGETTPGSLFKDNGYLIGVGTGSTVNIVSGEFDIGSSGVGTTWPNFANRSIGTGSTIAYVAGAAQTVSVAPAYQNLELSGAGAKTTSGGTLTVSADCDVGSGTTVALNTNNTKVGVTGNFTTAGGIVGGTSPLTVQGTATLSAGRLLTSTGSLSVGNTTSLTGGDLQLDSASGTNAKKLSGTVLVSGGTLSGTSNYIQFENGISESGAGAVSITGTSTFQTTASQSLNGTIGLGATTIGSGVTLTNNGTTTMAGQLTLTGNWTQANGSELHYDSTSDMTGAGNFSASTATNTVDYGASGTQTVEDPNGGTAHTYNNLTLSGTSAKTITGVTAITGNFTLSGTASTTTANDLAVAGQLTVNTGTTLTLGNYVLTLSGTGAGTSRPFYMNGGTLNEGTGSTVKYTGYTTTTDIQGESYNNLELSPAGGAGTTYTLNGAGGSDSNGTPQKIDDASNFGTMPGASRQVVRTSGGTLYAMVLHSTTIDAWKSTDGTSWSNVGVGVTGVTSGGQIAIAIDSTNTIQISYPATDSLKYTTFNTGTDSFGSSENILTSAGVNIPLNDIAVDSANKPHVVFWCSAGVCGNVLGYVNKTTGSWTAPGPTLDSTAPLAVSIAVDKDNYPVASWTLSSSTAKASLASSNNPTVIGNWTTTSLDTSVNNTSGQAGTSIAVDTSGNQWVSYVDTSTNYVTMIKHNYADAKGTWQTAVTNSNAGYEPSLAINGTDVYAFYTNPSDNEIYYLKYTGSWTGPTALTSSGTYQDAKPKWSYWHNNGGTTQIDYLYSDGTDIYWNKLTFGGAGGTLTVSGNFTVNDGSGTEPVTVDATTNDPAIVIGGNLTLNNYTTWTKSDTATVTFNGTAGTVSWTDNNGTKQDIGKVVIGNGSVAKVVQLATAAKAQDLTVTNNATFSHNGAHDFNLNGNLTLDTGA